MNVEIATEAALFPEKKYINGIFVAVQESGPAILLPTGGQIRILTTRFWSDQWAAAPLQRVPTSELHGEV